mmetsp:Transcript_24418/g.48894  ORF Transcript_24418/g.48894 Transcript_24418/m.48894 type:complete len:249 (-) Transcript_24418:590-1336(-)
MRYLLWVCDHLTVDGVGEEELGEGVKQQKEVAHHIEGHEGGSERIAHEDQLEGVHHHLIGDADVEGERPRGPCARIGQHQQPSPLGITAAARPVWHTVHLADAGDPVGARRILCLELCCLLEAIERLGEVDAQHLQVVLMKPIQLAEGGGSDGALGSRLGKQCTLAEKGAGDEVRHEVAINKHVEGSVEYDEKVFVGLTLADERLTHRARDRLHLLCEGVHEAFLDTREERHLGESLQRERLDSLILH